jgi:hypothetical protein
VSEGTEQREYAGLTIPLFLENIGLDITYIVRFGQ